VPRPMLPNPIMTIGRVMRWYTVWIDPPWVVAGGVETSRVIIGWAARLRWASDNTWGCAAAC
jgi:hypothetical protein